MHQQLLRCITHRRPLRLGVDHDPAGHLKIGGFIHEDVAVPCTGFYHRCRGILGNEGDQSHAAARNNHVNQPPGFSEFLHRLPCARIEELDCSLWHSRHRRKNFHQPLIAARRFFAAAQHDGVARFQREDSRIHSNVRSRLVDNSHHSQRHAHLADAQAVGAGPLHQSLANRIAERRHFAHPLRHLPDSHRGQQQAVAHSTFETRTFHIFPVGRKNRLGLGFNRIGDRQQQHVLLVRGEQSQFRSRCARAQQLPLRGNRAGNGRRHQTLPRCGGK